MKHAHRKLAIEQLDKKLAAFSSIKETVIPHRGWIHTIRTGLNMSLAQLAKRLGKTVPTVKEIEEREANQNITLMKLNEAADALGFRVVYGLIPKEHSLEKMIEKRAYEVAHNIVMRTSHSMKLEDQENQQERLKRAIKDRADNIISEMPRILWD